MRYLAEAPEEINKTTITCAEKGSAEDTGMTATQSCMSYAVVTKHYTSWYNSAEAYSDYAEVSKAYGQYPHSLAEWPERQKNCRASTARGSTRMRLDA